MIVAFLDADAIYPPTIRSVLMELSMNASTSLSQSAMSRMQPLRHFEHRNMPGEL